MSRHGILIVDDEKENITLLANLLGGEGRAILEARSGEEALELLQAHPVDLILTDQRMPGMSGVELLERAHAARPDGVRMLVTAYPDVTDAIDAINRGHVNRYVTKPFEARELKLAVERELEHLDVLRANRRLSDEMAGMVDELFKANRELRDLNRMKDQFLANCSHELKTPLVSGMGYVDLLLAGGMGPLEGRQAKGLQIAYRNLDRLLGLIENLLALAKGRFRPEALRVARFALRPLVEECVESLKARARKRSLRVRVSWPRGEVLIEGDERKIHSVFTNVLANAEKFSPEDARIEIRVRAGADGRCRVEVLDNGKGPEAGRGEIEMFKTTSDPRTAGLGIGLTLARQILEAHGGTIRLERIRRGGAKVFFDLPLAPKAPKASP